MKGWTRDGAEVELSADQETAVRCLLDWDRNGACIALPRLGRQGGKSTVMATVAGYLAMQDEASKPSDQLRWMLAHGTEEIRHALHDDAVLVAEAELMCRVVDELCATREQVSLAYASILDSREAARKTGAVSYPAQLLRDLGGK